MSAVEVRECPRQIVRDCPRRTVHLCPADSRNFFKSAKVRERPPTFHHIFFNGSKVRPVDCFNLNLTNFPYSKIVRKSPRMSAKVCRTLFQFFSRTFADCRGLSQTVKSLRESEGHKWTFADFRGHSRTRECPRMSAKVLKPTVLRRTFADVRGLSRTFADRDFSRV